MASRSRQCTGSTDLQSELYLFLIELGIQNRPALYARAGLANVNGNGGNKINKKLLPVLRTLEVAAGKPGAVQNAIDNLKAAKAAGVAEGSPSKAAGGKAKKGGASAGAGGSKMSPGKKRKVDEVAGDVKVEVRAVKDEEDELDESE